jgi:hypothetical protein
LRFICEHRHRKLPKLSSQLPDGTFPDQLWKRGD